MITEVIIVMTKWTEVMTGAIESIASIIEMTKKLTEIPEILK